MKNNFASHLGAYAQAIGVPREENPFTTADESEAFASAWDLAAQEDKQPGRKMARQQSTRRRGQVRRSAGKNKRR